MIQNHLNRRTLAILFALVLLTSFSIIPAQAQDAEITVSPTADIPTDPDSFKMNMREADIRAFIQWIADRTKQNIVVHRSVRGTVTVISSREINRRQAYELFLTVLQMNGFAAVEIEGGIKVIPDAEAKTSSTPFEGEQNNDGEIVTAVLELKYSDPNSFVSTLRPLIPATAHLAPYPATNSLIVADTARGIERIHELIDILDKKETEFNFEIVPVIHASADDLVSIINSVLKANGSGENGNGQPQGEKISLAVDERSNSILITGNVTRRKQVKNLIQRLDTPLEGNGNTSVVYLNYIEATEIVPILEGVGDSLLKETKTEGVKSFSIQSSETTNALIISAPPAVMNSLQSVITQLDIQRAQVLVEAVVVRVTEDLGDDFGLAAVASDAYNDPLDGSVVGVNSSQGATDASGLFTAVDAANATDSSLSVAAGVVSLPGLSYGYLQDGNLIAALRAIASRSKSNIMSTPTVVALDNEEASLLVGQNVPFVTGSATSSGSSVTNPFQTIERQDVGITLNITPRINQGDAITLEIEQTTENVSETTTAGASDLVTDKTEIKTSALIKDGQVLVLGGLMSETDSDTRSQVPILGDIPWLGKLFRSTSKSKMKSNLMVFIKPTILKEQLQIANITADRYAFMRQKQMQNAMANFLAYNDPATLDEFEVYSPQTAELLEQAGYDATGQPLDSQPQELP